MAQAVGIIDVIWRGRRLPVEKGAKFLLGGIKNAPVVYGRGVARSQEMVGGTLEFTTIFQRGQTYADLFSPEEGELQIHLDTGQIYTMPDAFQTERASVTGGEGGKVALKFEFGPNWEEVNV